MTHTELTKEHHKEHHKEQQTRQSNDLVNTTRLLDNLAYQHGKPAVSGRYKQYYEDFHVQEDLGFELTGEGEHIMVYLQKRDCNTVFVAEQLAKFAGISAKLVSYAGLKDRHAVTEQWFSLHMPGKATPDFTSFSFDGCQILKVTRHNKKLKIGALKGNAFTLCLREITSRQQLDEKLTLIAQQGVPNYFGEQRFGRDGNNIEQVLKWANGTIRIQDRKKRSFYLSAARSAIFNHIVSQRIVDRLYKTILNGDILQLVGRGSWFIAEPQDLSILHARLLAGEINLTAPMVGDLNLATQNEALAFEQRCLQPWLNVCDLLKKERVETLRRSILLRPQSLCWTWTDDATVEIKFFLPSGCYATSLLRELIINDEKNT